MNISSIFPQENKEVVTQGDILQDLELDSEEVKWCTDTWLSSYITRIHNISYIQMN